MHIKLQNLRIRWACGMHECTGHKFYATISTIASCEIPFHLNPTNRRLSPGLEHRTIPREMGVDRVPWSSLVVRCFVVAFVCGLLQWLDIFPARRKTLPLYSSLFEGVPQAWCWLHQLRFQTCWLVLFPRRLYFYWKDIVRLCLFLVELPLASCRGIVFAVWGQVCIRSWVCLLLRGQVYFVIIVFMRHVQIAC